MAFESRQGHGTPASAVAAAVMIVLAILLYDIASGSSAVDAFYVKVFAVLFLAAGIAAALPI